MPDYFRLKGIIQDAADRIEIDMRDRVFDWCTKLQLVPGFSSGSHPGSTKKAIESGSLNSQAQYSANFVKVGSSNTTQIANDF